MGTVPNEKDVLSRLRNHDKKAFDIIYEQYWLSLYRIAFKILNEEEASKDTVQEVFVSLWEKCTQTKIHNLEGYLSQAVKYQCFMILRSGVISKKHLEKLNKIMLRNSNEEDYDFKELQWALENSIESLPHRCREVFYLSRYESLSNKKIAERLNISHKTVENQITKALRVLRRTVDKMAILFLCSLNM